MMKGQLLPFVFLVFLVSAVIIGYIFFNWYYGTRYKIQTLHISVIDVVGNVVQSLKNYLKLSLSYSDLQALREHACSGGTVGATSWIVNGPNPVSVQQSKECLGKYALYYFNIYLDLFNTSLPVNITKSNFINTIYDINETGVFSGNYDEGNFWVNSSGAIVLVSGVNRNISSMENLNYSDFVTKNRYWYMFRNFYEWAKDDVYSPCICSIISCSCGSGSGEEVCSSCSDQVGQCAAKALDDLQKRFDNDVTCRKDSLCCQQGVGPSCLPPSGCIAWEDTSCKSSSNHECIDPSTGHNPCPIKAPSSISTSSYSSLFPPQKSFSAIYFSPACSCDYWREGRLSAGYKYTCQDFKYYVPSDKGPVPLTFSVTAYAFLKDQDVCRSTESCDCSSGSGNCCTGCG